MNKPIRTSIHVLIGVVSVLGLINVYSDNADVEAQARKLACPTCESTLTRMERTPLGQTFHLQIDASNGVIVRCEKSAVFFGDYACTKQ